MAGPQAVAERPSVHAESFSQPSRAAASRYADKCSPASEGAASEREALRRRLLEKILLNEQLRRTRPR